MKSRACLHIPKRQHVVAGTMSSEEEPEEAKKSSLVRRLLVNLGALTRTLFYLLGIAWATGAVYYDAPLGGDTLDPKFLAFGYLGVVLLTLFALGSRLRRFIGWLVAMAVVAIPWSLKKPPQTDDWLPAWSRLPSATIENDLVTIRDFRNFDYALDGTATERWEERQVSLSNLQGLDFFHHQFENELLAHPVLSFDFGPDGQVAFSIEVRYAKGQDYSPLHGLYKQFTMIYLVGDERDLIRDRATIRDEQVRLYRSTYTLERIREIFLETIEIMNDLQEAPRFYNSVTSNCTTAYITQAPSGSRVRFDYRIILNGRIESLLYDRRVIATDGLSFEDLVEQATINEAAREAHNDPEFSKRIRENRPGY